MARPSVWATALCAAALLLALATPPAQADVDLCGTGNVFDINVACENFQGAADIVRDRSQSTTSCLTVLACRGGTELATVKPLRGSSITRTECWKRRGAREDDCSCLCEAVRYQLDRKGLPGCQCLNF